MKNKNIGFIDKIVRSITGLALIYIGATLNQTHRTLSLILFVIGIILIVTVTTGFCGLYALLGIDTRKNKTIKYDQSI